VQLHRDREAFERAGVSLAVIGQGTPAHAQDFLKQNKVDGLRVLVDPARDSYNAAGTKIATFGELLGPRVVAKGTASSIRTGLFQTKTKGHPAQLGGVLIVRPDGSVPYAHLADDASDNPPNDEVLDAARRATA
jgi:prostamide/prostaglandin F2alpha synthase